MKTTKATLAVDVGASKIAGALVSSDYEILHELVKPARTSLYGSADPDLTFTKMIINELLDLANSAGIEVTNGGACFAEYVTPGQLLNSKDQIAWSIQPKEDFAEQTGFNWVIESDVRAMALAESKISNLRDFLFVTVSSGISHTLVINGNPWAGATGEAIGFGITQIDNSQESPLLEEFSSGLGIARRYQKLAPTEFTDAVDVFALYEKEQAAREIIDSAAQVLGKSLAAMVDYLDPAIIVMGGGLWLGSDLYRSLVKGSYLNNATKRRPAPEILNSKAGSKAAVIGAAIAANNL